ncbi:MAG: MmgE/PrpD family protein [Candidatus Rokubacteria bacterium]|nr:MmgE/PrpD family protein [Candidatus Rokubacteria bacterium]
MERTTRELAEVLAGVEFEALPAPVIEQVKKCLLDFVGVALAGAGEPAAQKVCRFFCGFGGPPEATLIRLGGKTPAPMAALINGSMAHGLELDDGHILAHAHPGVTTIPAALAMAEKLGSSGRELITAIATGYEPVIRIGDAITPSALYVRGFHTGALVGTFGAAVAAGKLLHLDAAGMAHALGNCCLTPAASFQAFKEGAMVKDLYGGWPAYVGTLAALLATEGVTGPVELLEGRMGFCRNVSDDYDLAKITRDLGRDWTILGVYFKRHASCSLSHTAVDAVLALADAHPVALEQIERVIVRTHRFASDLDEKAPTTAAAAKTSLPFCVAVALHERRVSLEEFSFRHIASAPILDLARRVEVRLDPVLDAIHTAHENLRPTVVEVHLRDGRLLAERRDVARGWPVEPLTNSELEAKFMAFARASLSETSAAAIVDLVKSVETLSDITPLMEAMTSA